MAKISLRKMVDGVSQYGIQEKECSFALMGHKVAPQNSAWCEWRSFLYDLSQQ